MKLGQRSAIIVQLVYFASVKLPIIWYNESHECSRSLGHKEGCKELEECTGFSFSSWLIDGPHILRGGARHLQHREMLPNKGKEAVFCFFLSRGLCFSWTKAFVKSFITVAALNRTTLEKKWEQILAGGMLFLKNWASKTRNFQSTDFHWFVYNI